MPLLLCALAVERFGSLLRRMGPAFPVIEKGTGVLLAILGLLLLTGEFSRWSTRLISYFPGWNGVLYRLGL